MAESSVCAAAMAPLYGLVLAGGRAVRLQRDKGTLEYHGLPQVRWALAQLAPFCAATFASIRPDQTDQPPYRDLPVIIDRGMSVGPASGLWAALRQHPGVAWLLLAADMPLVDPALLGALVAARDPAGIATAYRHRDGTPEPLCAIWEPAIVRQFDVAGPAEILSLRRWLERGPAKLLEIDDDGDLCSVNTAADDARVRQRLARR